MSGFLWNSGHLGWGVFALLVFSGLWLLVSDLVWRQKNMSAIRFCLAMCTSWVAAAVVIVLAFYAIGQ